MKLNLYVKSGSKETGQPSINATLSLGDDFINHNFFDEKNVEALKSLLAKIYNVGSNEVFTTEEYQEYFQNYEPPTEYLTEMHFDDEFGV